MCILHGFYAGYLNNNLTSSEFGSSIVGGVGYGDLDGHACKLCAFWDLRRERAWAHPWCLWSLLF